MSTALLAPAGRRADVRGILRPFRHPRAVFVVCVLVALVLLTAAIALSGSAAWSRTELGFDQALSRGHVPALDAVALTIGWVLSPLQGLVLVILVSLGVLWRTRDAMVFLTFALTVAGGWLSSELVKIIVHRARPDYHLLAHPLSTEVNNASFPSGHTCLATALAVGIILLLRGRRSQWIAIAVGAVGAIVVAWSRLYIGAHYPADVVGAVVYTTAVMFAFLAVWTQWLAAPVERLLLRPRSAR
ncbi:phosphatase PAP2 family protein [Leifsonia poae]|uniref:phosphatase PAP2 family protein n=1 Tax=Leifsonia poae TaxID=110933 RepID=UPI001CBEE69C|nr:phosphatase PAP2 family protein [Leifsonia poae]